LRFLEISSISYENVKKYFLFIRAYDPERDYARMKAAGVFKGLGKNIFIEEINTLIV
jgi:hypothetical protein